MCDDVEALMETMKQQGFACSPVQDEGWGLLTLVALPGGGKLGIYRTTSRTSASQTALSLHHLPIFQPQQTVGHADDLQHAL